MCVLYIEYIAFEFKSLLKMSLFEIFISYISQLESQKTLQSLHFHERFNCDHLNHEMENRVLCCENIVFWINIRVP